MIFVLLFVYSQRVPPKIPRVLPKKPARACSQNRIREGVGSRILLSLILVRVQYGLYATLITAVPPLVARLVVGVTG